MNLNASQENYSTPAVASEAPAAPGRGCRLGLAVLVPLLAAGLVASAAGSASASAGQAQVSGGRASSAAGSVPVGSASYPLPVGSIYVATNGQDSAAGTAGAPVASLAHAVSVAPAGSTIVLRTGTYHESISTPAGKALTIQNYPGEAVWMDGSSTVSNWVADGAVWRSDGYAMRFDHSPTYTPGAPDNTTPGWSFTNSTYPMAAYPDQVFVDGIAQQQVKTLTQVVPGTFYADLSGSHLYMGSNPAGHQVRDSDLTTAVSLHGAGSTLRGIGVRHYATSVPLLGTVRALAADNRIENVEVSDNASQGIYVGANTGLNATLEHVTASRNGLMGISAGYADGLTVDAARVVGNNTEHFNTSPSAGGFKVARTRGVTLSNSVLADNNGSGFWTDESTYNVTATGNDVTGNKANGMSFEISNRGIFTDNLLANNTLSGLKINDSGDSVVWNNTFSSNGYKPLWIVQDSRQASNRSTAGHDPRQAFPDPTMTWTVNNIDIHNNIFGATTSNCLLCVEDAFLHHSASTMHVTTNNNIFNRATVRNPTWLTVWASGATNPFVYTSLSAFRTATGQETNGVELTGPSVLAADYSPNASTTSLTNATAAPLTPLVATTTGRASGSQHLGAWTS